MAGIGLNICAGRSVRQPIQFVGNLVKTFLALIISLYATLSMGADTFIPTPGRTVLYNGNIDGHAVQVANGIVQIVALGDRMLPIDIIISSNGGSVSDGAALVNAIDFAVQAGIDVRCLNAGHVNSMAFMIFMHCHTRLALAEATFLFHYPAMSPGNDRLDQATLLAYAAELKVLEDQFVTDLEYYLHTDEASIRQNCKDQTVWTVETIDAYSAGFVTVVSGIQGVTLRALFQ